MPQHSKGRETMTRKRKRRKEGPLEKAVADRRGRSRS
jgi:hypothetical protein